MSFKIDEARRGEDDLRVYRFDESPRDIYSFLRDRLLENGYALKPPFYDMVKIPGLETEVKIVCVEPYWIAIRKTGEIKKSADEVEKSLKFFDEIISEIVKKD